MHMYTNFHKYSQTSFGDISVTDRKTNKQINVGDLIKTRVLDA